MTSRPGVAAGQDGESASAFGPMIMVMGVHFRVGMGMAFGSGVPRFGRIVLSGIMSHWEKDASTERATNSPKARRMFDQVF